MTVHKNLRISLLFFKNNVESKFHTTVIEKLEKYTPQERGSPLYFITLIKLIFNNGVSVALKLIQKVKELDIKKIRGEDMFLFSKWLQGLLNLCKALEIAGSATIVTEKFPNIVIGLLTNTC